MARISSWETEAKRGEIFLFFGFSEMFTKTISSPGILSSDL